MVHGMSIKSNTMNNMSKNNIQMDKTINDNDQTNQSIEVDEDTGRT